MAILLHSGCNNQPAAPPNLLFILADDLTKRDLGCFGSPNAKTPHIDQLATEGMRFENCFSAVAMCAPLRMQLYTGLFPVKSGAWPNHSKVYADVESVVQYLKPLGYRVGLSGKSHVRPDEIFTFDAVKPAFDESAYLEFINRSPEPFALFICSNEPHLPWDKGDSTHFDPSQLVLYEDQLDTPEFRRALCRYYAEIEYLDQQVGAALAALAASGKEEHTMVMFATEQGAQMPGSKWTLYDAGIQAGLIVKWPGKVQPQTVSHAMVNYVDILPTFMDIVGLERPEEMDGRSFRTILSNPEGTHQEYVFGIHTQKGAIGSPEEGYPVRSVRSKQYALIHNLRHEQVFSNALTTRDGERYWSSWMAAAESSKEAEVLMERYLRRPEWEFYDVEKDPLQLQNLAEAPQHAEEIEMMKRVLSQWMKVQGDEGVITEDMAYTRNFKYNP